MVLKTNLGKHHYPRLNKSEMFRKQTIKQTIKTLFSEERESKGMGYGGLGGGKFGRSEVRGNRDQNVYFGNIFP